VPVATALALATGLSVAFVRKTANQYGTMKLAEGPKIEGKRHPYFKASELSEWIPE
jgi:orotate phosphoribosyltransferase